MTNNTSLLAICPLDGRYQNKTIPLQSLCSEYALNRYRIIVEVRWLQAITAHTEITLLPPLTDTMHATLDKLIESFDVAACEQLKTIEATTNHDVKAVEYYIKEYLANDESFKPYFEFIHFACTSEDINNLSYALMLKEIRGALLLPDLNNIIKFCQNLAQQTKDMAMISRTHGQLASPTTLGKEIANVVFRLKRQMTQLSEVSILGKINGAVGNFNAHAISSPDFDWIGFAQSFVEKLDLTWNPLTTQIEPHDFQAEFYHVLSRINTILIDFSRDIWGYISLDYFKQKMVAGEIGSSTMPHKVNPIDFENAEGNFGLSNALLTHLAEKLPISRWQRDLTDSTVQRNIGVAMGYHTLAMQSLSKGLNKLEVNQAKIQADVDSAWVILAEAIQTVMRQYQVPQAYEKLKTLTRGKALDQATLSQFIETLDLPREVKERLKQLTPERYTGLASQLVDKLIS